MHIYMHIFTIASKINVTPKIVRLAEKLQHSVNFSAVTNLTFVIMGK